MRGGSGRVYLRRPPGDSAESHQQGAVTGNEWPACHTILNGAVAQAQNMGKQHFGRRMRIGVTRPGEPAGKVQKAAQLALRVVKPPGTGPAVRPCENGAVAMLAADAAQFLRAERGGTFP